MYSNRYLNADIRTRKSKSSANYINHIGLVIDQSSSMMTHRQNVIKVTDSQVQYLAQRSKDLDQETRATAYLFDNEVECIHYDKDVLRLPSLSQVYRPDGMTALVDATLQCINDLEKTPELYGDHAFLIYVITDGGENASNRMNHARLTEKLRSLRDNWTVAVLVPNQMGAHEAKKFGFPAANISVWDANSTQGFVEVGKRIQEATENWMQARKTGVRGSSNLFNLDVTNLTTSNVVNTLTKLRPTDYQVYNVDFDTVIKDFVEKRHGYYRTGAAYYQISKAETIQPQKSICVVDRIDGNVFSGPQARTLLALPSHDNVRVKPSDHSRYDIFVQSTSVNRKLIGGTKLLVLK